MKGASEVGEAFYPGEEPELAEGVRGILFDLPDGIWIPFIRAENPGNGDVARFLDGLPTDRRIIFPSVLSLKLEGMLTKRGFVCQVVKNVGEPEYPDEPMEVDAMVREART